MMVRRHRRTTAQKMRLSGTVGAALAAIVALAALPAAAGAPSSTFGLRSGGPGQAPGCVPVPDAVCGSVRVPLFRSKPSGRTIDIAYVLITTAIQRFPRRAAPS